MAKIDDYFTSRVTQELAKEAEYGGNSKFDQLQRASQEKAVSLREAAAKQRLVDIANEGSLVKKLGLDEDSTTGQAVNIGASVYSGASRVVGDMVGFVAADVPAMLADAAITEDELAAINRHKQGKATREDLIAISRKKAYAPPTATPEEVARLQARADANGTGVSPLERFEQAMVARQRSANINDAFDRSGLVHSGRRDALSEDLGKDFQENWDQTKQGAAQFADGDILEGSKNLLGGVADLLYAAGEAAITNPGAATEYIAENAPQLFMGAAGVPGKAALLLSNVGYASENYQQGIAKFQEENNGTYPEEAQRREMALAAASLAVAEHVTDTTLLKQMGLWKKTGGDAVKTGFKESLKNVGKATATGVLTEAATEGYQTKVESIANLTPVTDQQVYEGAVIGGMSGGGLTGGGRAVSELMGNTPEQAEARKTKAEERAAFDAAVATNDTSAYLDPKAPSYSPSKAVGVLLGNNRLANATPETKAENNKRVTEIVSELDESIETARKGLIKNKVKATLVPDMTTALEAKTKELKTADPATAEQLQKEIAVIQATLEAVKPDALKRSEMQLEKMEQELVKARKLSNSLSGLAQKQEGTDIATQVTAANAKVDQTNTEAVTASRTSGDAVINLAMRNPSSLTPEQATQLADNTDNGLSSEQRSYLRTFSAARQAANAVVDLKGVSAQVYTGGGGNVGIKGYEERMGDAVALNSKSKAESALDGLTKFAKDHSAKAKKIQEAFAAFKKDGVVRQLRSDGKGGWSITQDGMLSGKELDKLRANGGLQVYGASVKLVANIPMESTALNAALATLTANYNRAFNTKVASPAPAVQAPAAPTPTPAASTESAPSTKTEAETASEAKAPAEASRSGEAEVAGKETTTKEKAAVESASSLKDRTDENSGSTVRPTETVEPVAQEDLAETVDQENEVFTEREQQEETNTESGALSLFSQQSTEPKGYKQRNLIADFFTQLAQKDGDATKRPLAVVKDFLASSMEVVRTFVQEGFLDETQATQRNVLKVFGTYAKDWRDAIDENLIKLPAKGSDFYYQDLMQFFIDEGGNTDENVKTAISYAAFSWIAENASRSEFNTDEEINLILNRDENAPVGKKEKAALGAIGTRQNVVINSLGQRAVQALGLKAKKDAPSDLMPRLESALGAHVMKLLMDKGVLARTIKTPQEMAELLGDMADPDSNASHQFLKLVRSPEGELNPVAAQITEASRGTNGVLDKLFGVESGLKEPSLTPIPFTQKNPRNTKQKIPAKLATIIEHENAQANYVREDMWRLANMMDTNIMLEIAGAENESVEATHVVNRTSIKAKNDGLARELERFLEFTNSMKDIAAGLYFEHTVWKQQRVGIATNVINPQTSKIHRHMLFRKTWETKVSFDNDAQMENYRLRVAEGLGVKTDKQSNEKSLVEIEAKLQNEVIQSAVDILARSFDETLTLDEQEIILQAVKAGGEKMHSLDALMALAHEKWAKDHGKDSFTVQMMGEVDGVTNGPMLSHLLMGAANSVAGLFDILNRGGFYREGDAHDQYNLWRGEANHLDLYEITALHMTQAVQGLIKDKPAAEPILSAIYSFTGSLTKKDGSVSKDGRNIIKTPLTAMVFGSSTGKAVESMADKFVENVYSRMEDVANGKADKAALINDLKTLGVFIDPKIEIKDLLELEIKGKALENLKSAFKNTLGTAVENTMAYDFAAFIEKRKQFNLTAQVTFEMFNAAFTGIHDQYIQELIDAKEIEVNGAGKPVHDLTAEQNAALRKRLMKLAPVMHTLMSKDSGSLAAGLRIAKSARKMSPHKTYESTVHFGSVFKDNKAKTTLTRAMEIVETAPGVAMAPMSVHSTDSAISHYAAMLGEVLNVHDAHGAGLATFEQTAKNLNQATWNAMLNYSPASEVSAAMSRTLLGLAELLQSGNTPPQVVSNLAKVVSDFKAKLEKETKQEIATADVLTIMLSGAKSMAFEADSLKYEAMSQMAAIDQYALQGGNYKVTAEDRAAALAKMDALTDTLTEKERAALEVLKAALTGKELPAAKIEADPEMDSRLEVKTTADLGVTGVMTPSVMEVLAPILPELDQNKDLVEAINEQPIKQRIEAVQAITEVGRVLANVMTPFGLLGKPVLDSDPDVVALFEDGEVQSAKRLMVGLYRMLDTKKKSNVRDYRMELLKQLLKSVPEDLTVRLITANTPHNLATQRNTDNARGWYSSSVDGSHEIQVLGTDYAGSALTTELLMHELLHGALARMLRTQKNDPAVAPLIAELEKLMARAKEQAEKDGTTNQYKDALENLDEFISWGMTNVAFQKDVLSKVTMRSTTKKNTLVSGMKAFIKNITGILFNKSDKSHQAIAVNGMSLLISNVSGLLSQTSQSINTVEVVLNQLNNNTAGFTTQSLYEQLDGTQLTSEFDTHLQDLLGRVVEKLHGPFGSFMEPFMKNAVGTAFDTMNKAIVTGIAPFSSKITVAGLGLSSKEMFASEQVEATVRAALNDDKATSHAAYRELSKLYMEARNTLKPLVAGNPDLQKLYDFAFAMELNGDKTDHLSRFAALGLAHQEFNKLLNFSTETSKETFKDQKTIGKKLQYLFDKMLEAFNTKLTHTFRGQKADEKLNILVSQLADIEAKRIKALQMRQIKLDLQGKADDKLSAGLDVTREKLEEFGRSKFFRNSKSGFVRLAGSTVSTLAGNRQDIFMDQLIKMYDKYGTGSHNFAVGMLQDARGPRAAFQALLRGSKHLQKIGIHIATQTEKFAEEGFINEGKDLTREDRAAISSVFLRTGAHSLLDNFSMDQIQTMLDDPKALNKAIDDQVQALGSFPKFIHYFVYQSKVLGYNRATGKTKGAMLMQNAGNIAKLYGTPYAGRLTKGQESEAEASLDVLVALYALSYTNADARNLASKIMTKEAPRTDGHGVQSVLALHRRLEQESRKRLFAGQEALMMKGHLPEVYNPHIDILVAGGAEAQSLIDQGYEQGPEVTQDSKDPNQQKQHIYKMKDGAAMPLVTGITSYEDNHAKGKGKHNGNRDMNTFTGFHNVVATQQIHTDKYSAIRQMFNPNPGFDPSKVNGNFLSPVVNNKGEIANWRYMMEERTKDDLLERDNNFAKLLGRQAATIHSKETNAEQNVVMVKAMHDVFKSEFSANTDVEFLEIGPDSPDAEMREIYRMLPEATKEAIRAEWGGNSMMVRKDVLNISFGYHKLTFASMFEKDKDQRSPLEFALTFVVEFMLELSGTQENARRARKGMPLLSADQYAKRSAMLVRKYERMWQEGVKEVKDLIVIKTGVVMLGNIISNAVLLKMQGVSMADIAKGHLVAFRGAKEYQRDNNKLFQLENQLNSGYVTGDISEIQREIARLKDALARNPVHKLIDAGLMPTIVEDVDMVDDSYSYKSALTRKVEGLTSKLNPGVVNAAKTIYMSRDGKIYQTLADITQMSDFVARYTLYQHLTKRATKPLDHDTAIQEASDAFINYDIPMHKAMTYMDDMGFTMFTKYFLRVQRVIFKTSKDHPASTLATLLMTNYLWDVSNILEGSVFNRIGNNPFNVGAAMYPGALDQLATVNMGVSLFK